MTKPTALPAPANDSTLVGGHLTRREALAFRAAIRRAHYEAVRIRPADPRYKGRHFARPVDVDFDGRHFAPQAVAR